jgi:hypothetical protein
MRRESSGPRVVTGMEIISLARNIRVNRERQNREGAMALFRKLKM